MLHFPLHYQFCFHFKIKRSVINYYIYSLTSSRAMSVCEQSITLEKGKVKNISDLIAIIQFQFSLISSSGEKEAIEKILTTGMFRY